MSVNLITVAAITSAGTPLGALSATAERALSCLQMNARVKVEMLLASSQNCSQNSGQLGMCKDDVFFYN